MKIFYLLFLIKTVLLCTICIGLSAQPLIHKIEFTGLTKTRESFLKQYITTTSGSNYDSIQIINDKQRLLNLGILSSIEIELRIVENNLVIIFNCKEMINTLPIFAMGKTDNTFWCKVGFQSSNFTGRADKLFAYYQYYDRHSFYLNYATDRLGNSKWGATVSLIKWATVEPLKLENTLANYNYTNYTGYLSAIRHLNFNQTIDFGVGIFNERFESQLIENNELTNIVQGDKLLSKIIFKSNYINYTNFYLNGIYNQLNIEIFHSLDRVENFITIFNDFRYFKKIGKHFNWANRLRTGIATNDDNPFAPFVLDSYLNIRGVGNRVDRGNGSVVINTEIRYTIFDKPILAAQGVGFLDVGSWRKPGGSFSDFTRSENMRAFSGIGFRLIYKRAFDTMLRIDYGYDYNNNTGIVIGIGQYF
jgi:outer membrane protein assembly factor BamA